MLPSAITTDAPNELNAVPSEATISESSVAVVHPPAGLSKTYAEPWNVLVPTVVLAAPTTIVSESIATAPKLANSPPSDAVSFADSVESSQPAAGFAKTYAAPCWLLPFTAALQ